MTLPPDEMPPSKNQAPRQAEPVVPPLPFIGTEPASEPGARSPRRHHLLLGFALVGLVLFTLFTTYGTNVSHDSRETSDVASETLSALEETKLVYAQIDPRPDVHASLPATKHTAGSSKSPLFSATQTELEEKAIQNWRSLTAPGRTAAWRNLGLTLALFNRPGSLDAFKHIADPAPPARRSNATPVPTRRTLLKVADIERSTIPSTKEVALWRTIFGAQPIAAAHVDSLRQTILRMHLGWFENIALERLYLQAGMTVAANQAHHQALTSATRLELITGGEGAKLLLGTLVWCVFGLVWFLRLVTSYGQVPPIYPPVYPSAVGYQEVASYPAPYLQGTSGATVTHAPLPATAVSPMSRSFSYRARSAGFVGYLALYLFIALPFRLLRPLTANLSSLTLVRLNGILQILVYVPVVWFALYIVRRVTATEQPSRRMPSFRETLAALGMRSSRPLADIGAGFVAYIMTVPAFLITSLISSEIFRHYHTPVNPIQIESMWALQPFDQILMLLETAIAAPIVEELMFRGILLPALSDRWGRVGGIAITSAVFALLHPNLPAGFLPLWTLGAAFAIVSQRRDSLLPNIVMHALHNGYVTVTMFLIFAK